MPTLKEKLQDASDVLIDNAKNFVKNPKQQAERALKIAVDSATGGGLTGQAKESLQNRGSQIDSQLEKYKKGGSVKSKVHSVKKTRGGSQW